MVSLKNAYIIGQWEQGLKNGQIKMFINYRLDIESDLFNSIYSFKSLKFLHIKCITWKKMNFKIWFQEL